MASDATRPELDAEPADAVGGALVVVLATRSPAERLAFVLHDIVDVPFRDIARVLGRSPAATTLLASQARRKVRGAGTSPGAAQASAHAEVVLGGDPAAVRMGAPAQVRGAEGVPGMFAGRALAAQPATIDGRPGIVGTVVRQPRVV